MKIIKVKAKQILTKTKLGADYVINPYVGCSHNCLYCYAKFIARWRPVEYGKWGEWVEAKINGPELIKGKKIIGSVFISSICDPYQPIEKELELTRNILQNLDKDAELSILTKSDLVLRDIDVLKKFKNVEVGLTINDFTGRAKKIFEKNSPDNETRINALKKIKEQGITTYSFVSPIIPHLTKLQDIVAKSKNYTDYYWFEFLNLRGAGKEFALVLQKEFPESFKIVSSKQLYESFVNETKQKIKKFDIKIKGIVKH